MINVIKIQSDLIKALIKGYRIGYCECSDGMWVTVDGICAYNIPKSQFFVDLKDRQPLISLEKNRDRFSDSKEVKANGEMKCLERFNVVKFVTADGEKHWLQEKYAKLCDSWTVYSGMFFGCNNGIPVVMVAEVRVKDDKD